MSGADAYDLTVESADSTAVRRLALRHRSRPLSLKLLYETFPDLAIVRKTLAVTNTGPDTVRLEAVDTAVVGLAFGETHAYALANYARQRRIGPFVGGWDDPAVVVHDQAQGIGLVFGNEAPGVLKRTSAFAADRYLGRVGLTRPDGDYPFREWLAPGETYAAPAVWTGLYADADGPAAFLRADLKAYTRRHLGARVHVTPAKPTWNPNSWRPFRNDSEAEMMDVARAAAEAGYDQWVLDAGWYTLDAESAGDLSWADRTGDWLPDPAKFPRGLGPLFDTVRALGMRPGLWISLTSAHPASRVYREHPEWFVVGEDAGPTNLHNPANVIRTACFATGWYDYIRDVILGYVRAHDLKYVKLDLSVVTSAYIADASKSGCYATDHPGHRDRPESFGVLYARLFALFDELHAAAPDLFIDCTFETAGKL